MNSCINCHKRHQACWDTCETYIKEKEERDSLRIKTRKLKENETLAFKNYSGVWGKLRSEKTRP